MSTRPRPGKAAILRACIEVMGEDGYEGASIREMATRAGVSVAALYYHFPSKLDLLRQFLDDAYDVLLARLERRLARTTGAEDRLDVVVATLVWSHLHDDFARLAAVVAFREYVRLDPPDRAVVEVKRKALIDLVEEVMSALGAPEPREAALAVTTLATSLVGTYTEMAGTLDDVVGRYQRYARAIASAG